MTCHQTPASPWQLLRIESKAYLSTDRHVAKRHESQGRIARGAAQL